MNKLLIGLLVVVGLVMWSGFDGTSSVPANRQAYPDAVTNSNVKDRPTFIAPDLDTSTEQASEAYTRPLTPASTWEGDEGTFTVENMYSDPVSTFEGDRPTILSLNVTAKGSQIYVQRIQLDLGTSKNLWLNIFKSVSIVDESGTVLTSVLLNKDSVTFTGGRYITNLISFSYAVEKNNTRSLYIRAEIHDPIDSEYGHEYTFGIPAKGIRALDGRKGDIYGPDRAVSASVIVQPTDI